MPMNAQPTEQKAGQEKVGHRSTTKPELFSFLTGLSSLGRQEIKASNIVENVVGRIVRCPLSFPLNVLCALYYPLPLSVDLQM